MSQQELEQTDQEVIDLVNGAAAEDAVENAEKIQEWFEEPRGEAAHRPDLKGSKDDTGDDYAAEKAAEDYWRKRRRQYTVSTVVCVVVCSLIAAMLLMVLFDPSSVVQIVNIGVLSCGIVAGIKIDRWIRLRKCGV